MQFENAISKSACVHPSRCSVYMHSWGKGSNKFSYRNINKRHRMLFWGCVSGWSICWSVEWTAMLTSEIWHAILPVFEWETRPLPYAFLLRDPSSSELTATSKDAKLNEIAWRRFYEVKHLWLIKAIEIQETFSILLKIYVPAGVGRRENVVMVTFIVE